MKETPLFEITVTGVENREWQGTVRFPASGEQVPFHSLLELIRVAEHGMTRMTKDPSGK